MLVLIIFLNIIPCTNFFISTYNFPFWKVSARIFFQSFWCTYFFLSVSPARFLFLLFPHPPLPHHFSNGPVRRSYNISKRFPRKAANSLSYIRIECWSHSSGWKHIHFTDLRLIYFNLWYYNWLRGSNVFIKCSVVRPLPSASAFYLQVWYFLSA
jgi:hypothetical protein